MYNAAFVGIVESEGKFNRESSDGIVRHDTILKPGRKVTQGLQRKHKADMPPVWALDFKIIEQVADERVA